MTQYNNQLNQERELAWDDEISQEGGEYIVLPAGDYDFVVGSYERGRHNGSEKLPPCNKATVEIKIAYNGENVSIYHNLFLHTSTERMLSAFFKSIGLKKDGESFKMNWNAVPGCSGRCKVEPNTYNGNTYNQIKKFYPRKEETKEFNGWK
ncbi:DUF669 domain-containing protein [Erysipelotrichaceae bacterium OH741_COT-311]|nr:DUF669 domain-containing protein [Erysipelotrichaceae bacterium OH741_COT-311]